MQKHTNVAIVGCGNIAAQYVESIRQHPQLTLSGIFSRDPAKTRAFGEAHGINIFQSLEELLSDPAVNIVVNLTIHHAHPEIIRQCLEAGKHVFSEKPLAMTFKESCALVDLADARGLRLSCAPITFLGEAQQTAMKIVRDGELGPVRFVYAEVNWGRIESWHPNPAPFYAVGPIYDVAVYPLTLLTALFGPVRQVNAYGRISRESGTNQAGHPFRIATEDFSVALIEFGSGPVLRLTSSFYVTDKSRQPAGIEFHGDQASLYLSRWHPFNGTVEVAPYGGEYAPVPLLRPAGEGVEYGRGIADLAEAITTGRPQRATGAHAAHVVEIIEAIHTSMKSTAPVEVRSSFARPAPMPWAH